MDPSLVARCVLVLIRTSTLVVLTPILGGTFAPPTVKIGLSLLFTLILVPVVAMPASLTTPGLVLLAAHEFAIGFALAMAMRVVTAAAEMGGYLIGFQLGFSYAGIIDPQSGVRNNVVAALYSSLTALTLLGINAHHAVLRALVQSYDALPMAPLGAQPSIVGQSAAMLGAIFYVGLQLAAPVIVVLTVVELMLGIITRATPSLNLLVVGAPVRLIIGLTALMTAVQMVPGIMGPMVHRALEFAVKLAAAMR